GRRAGSEQCRTDRGGPDAAGAGSPRARPRHRFRAPRAARVASREGGRGRRRQPACALVRTSERGAERHRQRRAPRGRPLRAVAGERFDLVVSNPPFVVGPDRRYVFRDGGPQFCARVLRGVRAVLAEGGVAVVMVGWGHGGHDVWRTPRGWVEEIGCDAAILRFADLDLLGNGWLHTRDADVAARWAGALDSAGIARVAYGAVLLRRRVGGGRVATIDAVGKDVPACGAQMLRILANLEWLDANEQALASARFAPAGDLELRTSEQLGASPDAPRPTRLALRRGLPLTVEADDALVAAIRRGSAEGDPSLTPRLRELLELGFLAGG